MPRPVPSAFLEALGGRENVSNLELGGDRLLVKLVQPERLDETRLAGLGARGIARPEGAATQILLGRTAFALYQELKAHLA
jgi:PTS system N-acetylglucosamine-specific IIC component